MKCKLSIPVPRSHPDYMKYYKLIRKEKVDSANHNWSEKNKIRKQKQWREWYSRNQPKQIAKSALERANRKKRTPFWSDLEVIEKIYLDRPEGYHVDHIVPLCGKKVSGLHVSWNLQYLEESCNLSKSNKY